MAQVADCSFDSFAAPTIITPEGDFPGGFWLPRLAMSTINAALGLILSVSSFGKTPKSSNAPSKSTNGTFLNGKRVLSQVAMASGDEIVIGKCRFVVDLGDKPEGVIQPPEADPLAQTRKLNTKEIKK